MSSQDVSSSEEPFSVGIWQSEDDCEEDLSDAALLQQHKYLVVEEDDLQEDDFILEEVVTVEEEGEDAIQRTESFIPIVTEASLQASLSSLNDHRVPSAHQRSPLERVSRFRFHDY